MERLNIVLVLWRRGEGGNRGREGGWEEKKIPMQPQKWTWWSQRWGESHHSLLLTIKIRLASTVSTLAPAKAWQGREGGHPPVWEFAMWTMETPQCLSVTAQASDTSKKKPFLAHNLTNNVFSSILGYFICINPVWDQNTFILNLHLTFLGQRGQADSSNY